MAERRKPTPLLTAKEACEFLHVSMFTLSKIEREGDLVPFRTPGGHRRYSINMLRTYLESTRGHALNQKILQAKREREEREREKEE